MAEPQNSRHTPEQYEETTDPKNPPKSVLNPQVQKAALGSYLGVLVAFVVIVAVALLYWSTRGPAQLDPEDRDQIGTTGVPDGERGNRERTPGGFNPAPRPDSTIDELKYRGVDQPEKALPGVQRELTITGLAMLEGEPKDHVGRRVDIRNVNVIEVENPTHFWIQDGNAKTEVMAPRGGPAVKANSRVNVNGAVEEDGRGGVRIRAERVDVN
jgi:hypothetical protein